MIVAILHGLLTGLWGVLDVTLIGGSFVAYFLIADWAGKQAAKRAERERTWRESMKRPTMPPPIGDKRPADKVVAHFTVPTNPTVIVKKPDDVAVARVKRQIRKAKK